MLGLFTKNRKKEEAISIGEFAHQHKNLIIIVADPKDDTIFAAYNDRFASGKLKTSAGKDARIIRDMMANTALFDSNIDRFLMGLTDVLKIRRLSYGVNNFLQYLDGALYNIAMKHRKNAAAEVPKGSIPSPLGTAADVVDPGKLQ